MASKLRLAASAFAVVALVLIGTTAGIAANGNGNGNGNPNGQANGNGNANNNANANANANGNAIGNGNANGNANSNSNSNSNGTGTGNENGNGNGNGNNSNRNENGNNDENGNGQSAGNTTVTICHNPIEDASTIDVNDNAVPAHLAHGDHLGACAEPPGVEDEGDSQDEQETTDEQGDNSEPQENPAPTSQIVGSTAASPSETRSLYCSTKGPVDRGDAERPGIALDLPESQGASLVEKGLATPAIFYAGVGVSCDHLPGFVYSGHWVDHVGDVVEGIGVYPYYVPAS